MNKIDKDQKAINAVNNWRKEAGDKDYFTYLRWNVKVHLWEIEDQFGNVRSISNYKDEIKQLCLFD